MCTCTCVRDECNLTNSYAVRRARVTTTKPTGITPHAFLFLAQSTTPSPLQAYTVYYNILYQVITLFSLLLRKFSLSVSVCRKFLHLSRYNSSVALHSRQATVHNSLSWSTILRRRHSGRLCWCNSLVGTQTQDFWVGYFNNAINNVL